MIFGGPQEFVLERVGFRPLRAGDLPLLHRWINEEPQVRRWWGADAGPLARLVEKYAPRIAGQEPTRCFVIEYSAWPIGYIQDYLIGDFPGWARAVGARAAAAGVDLFIGEGAWRGAGRGSAILRRFVREVVFARLGVESCIIGPDETNARAIRSYEKAGFRAFKTIADPESGGRDLLLRITRAQALREDSEAPRAVS